MFLPSTHVFLVPILTFFLSHTHNVRATLREVCNFFNKPMTILSIDARIIIIMVLYHHHRHHHCHHHRHHHCHHHRHHHCHHHRHHHCHHHRHHHCHHHRHHHCHHHRHHHTISSTTTPSPLSSSSL